jgi:hypothetical protein
VASLPISVYIGRLGELDNIVKSLYLGIYSYCAAGLSPTKWILFLGLQLDSVSTLLLQIELDNDINLKLLLFNHSLTIIRRIADDFIEWQFVFLEDLCDLQASVASGLGSIRCD